MSVVNISPTGLVVTIFSTTYPSGIPITGFATSGTPLEISSPEVAELKLGVGGTATANSKLAIITVTLSQIPTADIALELMSMTKIAMNQAGGRIGTIEDITMTVLSDNFPLTTFTSGVLTEGTIFPSVEGENFYKEAEFKFQFGAVE